MSWFDRLKSGLSKTRQALSGGINSAFGASEDPEEILENLEERLISSDLGVHFVEELIEELEAQVEAGTLTSESVHERLRAKVEEIFAKDRGAMNLDEANPAVVLMIGVNGVGKTTTAAKLAHRFKAYGRTPILVAGDTFRAGATEQLKVWGERIGIPVVAGKPGCDPSSLAFEACSQAKSEGHDLVLVDTAGRLHTQYNLMKELEKIGKVVRKVVPGAPHESFLVVDATTGQNAVRQAEEFSKMVPLTGLVVTKLDGSAKGGCVVPVVRDLDVPVRFIGVGEGIEDLDNFRTEEYIDALFASDGALAEEGESES